ncbi:MAG: phosphatase PAP2 family protein [Anaerolineae bacterium]|nr:phosphatase PAP2 family protein [Phycisphaerae bacterium]
MIRYTRNILDWLGERGFIVLMAMLIVVAGTWGFIELAGEVTEGETQQVDERLVRVMRNPNDPADPVGPRWLEEAGRDVTALGGVLVLALMTATVVGYLFIDGKRRSALFVLFATAGGLILSTALKHFFDRPRPGAVPHLSYVYTSSFPSGHSMLSAAVYLTLGSLLMRFQPRRRLKIYFLFVATVLTVLVGISRVYMGVHYPTDVLAGWTAGLVWALICWLAARALQIHHVVERDYESQPKTSP